MKESRGMQLRLNRIVIRHFKGINEISLSIPKTDLGRSGSADFLTIIGRNNVGKSTVLEALRLALPGGDITRPTQDHFPQRDITNGPIEVELEFDELTPEDVTKQGVRTHVFEGTYRIKKQWSEPNKGPVIYAFHPAKTIPTLSESDKTRGSLILKGEVWESAVREFEEANSVQINRLNKTIVEQLKTFLIEQDSPLVIEGAPQWQSHPGGFSANVDSVLPQVIFVPAIKETKEEAGVSEKNSTARRLVEVLFSKSLANNPAIQLFTQAGEAVKNLFVGDGEGTEVIRELETRITTKLSRLIPLSAKLDFNPPDIATDLPSKTTLELLDGMLQTKPEHQGHGAQRALVLSLLELYAETTTQSDNYKPIMFLVEEPEIYLHPQMERKLRDVLLQIARSGTAQVICTSHSPIFIDLADRHDGICIIRKLDDESLSTIQRTDDLFAGDTDNDSRQRLRMLLNFDPTASEVFFASRVCLVEGDSEMATIEAVASKLIARGHLTKEEFLTKRREVSVINCRGKWTIRAFQRVLNGFGIEYQVVHDADAEGDAGANAAILTELNGNSTRRLVHTPNFEQDVFGESWSSDKPWKATKTIRDRINVDPKFLRFFEFVLGNSEPTSIEEAAITHPDC